MQQRYKVAILGDSSVGKSSICRAMIGREVFKETYNPTIGMKIRICDVFDIILDIWDISGNPQHLEIVKNNLTNLDAIIVVYTNETNVDEWLNLALHLDSPTFVVHNKRDVEILHQDVINVSAKTGKGIDNLKQALYDKLHV